MSNYICLRCSRQLLRHQSSRVRSISSSTAQYAGYRDLSEPLQSDSSQPQATKPSERSIRFGALIEKAQAERAQGPSISKYTHASNHPPARQPDGQPTPRPFVRQGKPLVIRREDPGDRSGPAGRGGFAGRGSFAGRGRGGAAPGGQVLLRRRVPSPSPGGSQDRQQGNRFRMGGTSQRGGARGRGDRKGGRPQRRRDAGEMKAMDPEEAARIEERIVGPSGLAKEALPYNPEQLSLEDFKADWPNTPLSVEGLVGSVQQKAEVLAARLPYGYISPDQLAERFTKGQLVRFESVEEKEKVLKKAAELANSRAEELTERKGEAIPTEDMGFSSIGAEDGKDIASKMGRGVYPVAEKQRMPFMNTVLRNLMNNGTYHNNKQEEFMAKIASLMPQPGAVKGARQQKRV